MNIILVSFGSSGDINPYLAVGIALKKRKHTVTFVTNEFFKSQIEENGLNFFQVGTIEEYHKLSNNPLLFHPSKAFEFIVQKIILKYMRDYYYTIKHLANGDTIIISQSIAPGPRIASEKLSIPLISLNLQPFSFWSFEEPPVFSGLVIPRNLPLSVKRFILNAADKHYIDKQYAPGINKFLVELGMAQQSSFFSKWMYSPQLVIGAFPEWFAPPAPDWPSNTLLTGFLALSNNAGLPENVKEFLKAGDPPLVFTAGSAMQHASPFFSTAIQLTKQIKKRSILITSYPEQIPGKTDENILICKYAPYTKLFPEVEAVIHHGGIGTVAHVLAAGKPQLIVPFAHDQPDNAFRVERIGAGIKVSLKKFKPDFLSHKLDMLIHSESVRSKCIEYSNKIDFDNSLNNLILIIEKFGSTVNSTTSKKAELS